jgi:AcrR family transcriptional regulator
VASHDAAERRDRTPAPLTAAQGRIVAAALELFGRYGVGGTSLQMIANEIGVTKAAVYHQYNTKEEIVLAAAEAELARLEAVIGTAEAERSPRRRRDALVAGIVELTVARRHTVGTILTDPIIGAHFAQDEKFRLVMHRLRRLVVANEAGPEARVRTAMLIAAVSGAVMHPFVAGLDDDVLRAQLLRLARGFLGSEG